MFVLYRYYVEACGHSSPPPPHFLLGARVTIGTVCFLCTGSFIPRKLSLFYVWGCFRLSLVSVGVGLMCVLTMLSLSTERP